MLNGITKMDAENYYVQSEYKDIKLLINILKNIAIKQTLKIKWYSLFGQ